jgi:SAM-dependent methyltransferase
VPTIIEPLRDDWDAVQSDAIGKLLESDEKGARETVKRFHDKLCDTLVLDPACGTGNFLYVALELMKRLEGEVLDFLKELGEPGEPLRTIDPHQFLGIEKNPRAVPIAELVLWIGYIQWWFRTRQRSVMQEPILRDFGTIKAGDAVLAYDREELLKDENGRPVTRQDPSATKLHPITGELVPDPDAKLPVFRYVNARPAKWPEADFIVGNPPFIGGKDLRAELGDGYTEALWASRGKKSDSIDFVMYWWDQAATALRTKTSRLRRFGFITTNKITQKFSRRVLETHLRAATEPASLVFAIPDHPWIRRPRRQSGAKRGSKAAVRIAMTVAERGRRLGTLAEVIEESALDTDQPIIRLRQSEGDLNSDLTVGADLTGLPELRAAAGISGRGVQLMGDGFIVTPSQASALGLGRVAGLDSHIKPYLNNRDLKSRPRGVLVIDLYGMSESDLRQRFPSIWQRLNDSVRIDRKTQHAKSPTKDALAYAERWWVFGKPREELRSATDALKRIIVTGETSRHRFFEFFSTNTIADNMIRVIAADDAYYLGVLSSHAHTVFSVRKGGWMGVGNDPRYQAECFSTFPFPDADDAKKNTIRDLAEELDALRKQVIAQHDFLTMTKLYNVRERLKDIEAAGRGGQAAPPLTEAETAIHDAGCVAVIHELHKKIDAAVADAYGWPFDLSDEGILARLVALNHERAEEERNGLVRWLRPDYQIPRFGDGRASKKQEQIEAELASPADEAPALPKQDAELVAALRQALRARGRPAEVRDLALGFRDGPRAARRIERGLQLLAAAGVARRSDKGWFVAERA